MTPRITLGVSKRAMEAACRVFGTRQAELMSGSRMQCIVRARFTVMCALRDAGWSYPRIGALLGKDHSTIINGVRRAGELRHSDYGFAAELIEVLEAARAKPAPVKADLVDRYCAAREARVAA